MNHPSGVLARWSRRQSTFERMEPKKTKNLVLSPKRLVEEQKQDPELCQLREQAVSELESHKVPMCRDDILMHKWRLREVPSSEAWRVVYQVVVPPVYREDVLCLAHETPLASHLGVNKTYKKILNHFKTLSSFVELVLLVKWLASPIANHLWLLETHSCYPRAI